MSTITINEPTSGMATELADGSAIVSATFPPCLYCGHNSKATGGCMQCKPPGGVCLPCFYRVETPVGTGPIEPPPPGPIVPPEMPG